MNVEPESYTRAPTIHTKVIFRHTQQRGRGESCWSHVFRLEHNLFIGICPPHQPSRMCYQQPEWATISRTHRRQVFHNLHNTYYVVLSTHTFGWWQTFATCKFHWGLERLCLINYPMTPFKWLLIYRLILVFEKTGFYNIQLIVMSNKGTFPRDPCPWSWQGAQHLIPPLANFAL